MVPRKKKAEPQQLDIEQAIVDQTGVTAAPSPEKPMIDPALTADLLIKREIELDDYISAQSKAFTEFCKPFRAEMEALRNRLLQMLLEQKTDSFKTKHGTAYTSTLLQHKIDPNAAPYTDEQGATYIGRDALLYYMLDRWQEYGNEALAVSIPVATVRQVMDDNNGTPPPGLTISYFTRVNVKRS